MSFYQNLTCPVCHKPFQEGEDIVTCPVCGTPHHRACFEQTGHCANQSLHASDFSFRRDAVRNDKPKDAQKTEEQTEEAQHCAACGAPVEKGVPFCSRCGARQPESGNTYQPPVIPDASVHRAQYKQYGNVLENEAMEDVAAVVRTNVPYFISRFVRNKKLSWNWGGFFFGPYYLFFRKMYRQGIVFLALQFIAGLFVQGFFADAFAALSSFINTNYTALYQGKMQIDPALIEQLYPAAAVLLAVNLVLHVLIALLCNGFYRQKVLGIVKSVDEKLESGGMFQQTPMMEEQLNLSQVDLRKLYLTKIGGVSVFAPIMAFFVLDLISAMISSII